jgi:integral membrane protein (TIGR01906 family)
MRATWAFIGCAAAVALVLLLVTSNVRATSNSLWLYEQLFERNEVPRRSGITILELRGVGATIQDYFNSDIEPLAVTASINGAPVSLFGDDEAAHMADVKRLFAKTYRLQAISALVLAIAITAAVYLRRGQSATMIRSWLSRGAIIAAGAITVIGIASMVAFEQVFLLFHYIGFPDGNFTFSTQTDYLVQVFPYGFWADITVVIGAMTLTEAAVLWIAVRVARSFWK